MTGRLAALGAVTGSVPVSHIRERPGQPGPEMRRLAEEIISAQGREIAFMTEWLAKTAK